uniref:Uncharacterized protein LOC100182841 n=1 Tax=Phallusia mammillata TaxID=59560 RepID=A0A6F9DHT8_9ASCI|nr:uncharacterized protein LOC100182841 [Phallusia mammillata]
MKILLWNYSDKCVNFCKDAYMQKTAIERNMREFSLPETAVKNLDDNTMRYFIKASMGFLHNVLRLYNDNRVLVRKNNGIQKILKYHESSYLIIKAKAMLILAYCIDDEENEKIMTGAGVIVFIMQLLTSALDSPTHTSKNYSFSALETVMGLNKLASNDDNKLKIVGAGILPSLHKMLGNDFSTNEKSVALQCLWRLSFHKENKEPIRKVKGLLDRVNRLKDDPGSDQTIVRPCDGIVFNLEEKPRNKETTGKAQSAGHIMISYQWDVQDTILELRTQLEENGHKVWLDVDRMEGSILSAMAEAVENASVVVVAMTERYKNSDPCRTESEYAYKLSKPIVPLLLEPKYKPNGWLGALLGMQLYVDISHEDWMEKKFPNVLQKINAKIGSKPPIVNESATVVDAPVIGSAPNRAASRQASAPTSKLLCRKWDKEDVAKWAKNSGIDGLASHLSSFDGPALEGLHKMLKRSPDFYYACVKAELKLNLLQMLQFTNALEDL